MSNIYIQEPPTAGKVLLKTSVGDIDIELWSKECPMACRNFIQLCLEGYYNGTIFHRVVKGFIVQGGDPNGDGTGGESVYEHPFKDEFHSRLRYVRRGLVGMANSGKNDNASQFFFTLGPTPELQNQNTLFGKVVGDTIYNMLKLEEGEVYENERPHFAHRIIRTDVLNNPFDDIVPRRLAVAGDKSREEGESSKKKKKGVKNFGLLSFGDEAEEEELEANVFVQKNGPGRGKSSHDVLDDPKLSKQTSISSAEESKKRQRSPDSRDHSSADEEELSSSYGRSKATQAEQDDLNNVREKLKRKADDKRNEKSVPVPDANESDSDSDYELDGDRKKEKREQAEKIRQEISQLKRDFHSSKRSKDKWKEREQLKASKKTSRNEVMNEVLKVQEEYSQKTKQLPKKGSSRENFTMELLQKFKSKLYSAHERDEVPTGTTTEADEEEDIRGDNWLAHRLEFEKKDPILAKDAATKDDDWYDVYDPRNPLNKRKRGEKIDRSQKPRK
ncbi:spliceosome-associated protein CWC27 homolog [Anopheles maculipalpis]|uniref:spliceosome-associated protein CWC27 homolog n=1 Tax=Anopheles maculipalpis TaxID=1496333 RepID=UPI002158B320|nr:spliceosome-associated protein CWC27 homolog [Anopheles maculipalpis]